MERGEIWEQHQGKLTGRRGVLLAVSPFQVVLDPSPGTCPCPLKQRRTNIRIEVFTRDWRRCD